MRLDGFSENVRGRMTMQSYAAAPSIEGVVVQELKYFRDDGGFFLEIGRLNNEHHLDGFDALDIKQLNYSEIVSGVVKAGHVHPDQNEIWFLPPTQRVLVGLMDVRKGSVTEGVKMRFVMGVGKAQLLYIPHGVAHGLSNPYDAPAHMLYLVSHHFDPHPESGQEYRIPPEAFGDGFWEIQRG